MIKLREASKTEFEAANTSSQSKHQLSDGQSEDREGQKRTHLPTEQFAGRKPLSADCSTSEGQPDNP